MTQPFKKKMYDLLGKQVHAYEGALSPTLKSGLG